MVAVLISAMVFLGLTVAITGTLALSSRQTTASQRVTLKAQYAAESGLTRVLADARQSRDTAPNNPTFSKLMDWSKLIQRMQTPATLTDANMSLFAAHFCNLNTIPAAPVLETDYCVANDLPDIPNRFAVFTQFLSNGKLDQDERDTDDYESAVFGKGSLEDHGYATEDQYWQRVFSPTQRYVGQLDDETRFKVSFGLKAVKVEYRAGGVYRFVFEPRDSVSEGIVIGPQQNVLATRKIKRSYQHQYFIDIAPPSYAYYLSLTNRQSVDDATLNGTRTTRVYFNAKTLLDGPVHTNEQFYFTDNPWFSDEVTSSGCLTGLQSTTNPITCVDANQLEQSLSQEAIENNNGADASVTNGEFSGYTTAGLTAPEFVKDNATPDAGAQPWRYRGEYDASLKRLPTSSQIQEDLARTKGILVKTADDPPVASSENPLENTYYNSSSTALPNALRQSVTVGLLATTDTEANTSVHWHGVNQDGTQAVRQLIRIQAVKKVSNCPAAPTAMKVLVSRNICAGGSSSFDANYLPDKDTYTTAAASDDPAPGANWTLDNATAPGLSFVPQGSSVTGKNIVNVKSTDTQTGVRTITATFPGLASQSAQLTVTPATTTIPGRRQLSVANNTDSRSLEEGSGTVVNGLSAQVGLGSVGSGPCTRYAIQENAAQNFSWSVTPNQPGVFALTQTTTTTNTNGFTVGSLPAGVTQMQFVINATVTDLENRQTTMIVDTIVVTKKSAGSERKPARVSRPRARLTSANTCPGGGERKAYPWPVFIDILIDKDGNSFYREFPSAQRTHWTLPSDGTSVPFTAGQSLKDIVLFVQGGVHVRTLHERDELSDPSETASRSIASFFKTTIATEGNIVVSNDLRYEQPPCTSVPTRDAATGAVTRASCPPSDVRRNALGLFTSGGNVVLSYGGLPNPALHAVVMASGEDKQIEVAGMRISDPNEAGCNTTGANNPELLGAVTVLGGLIQDRFGKFGRLSTTNGEIECGYERNMTYDPRMRDNAYTPPGFPQVTNQPWLVKIYTSQQPSNHITDDSPLPLQPGYSRNK
jgi:hypothetical protein